MESITKRGRRMMAEEAFSKIQEKYGCPMEEIAKIAFDSSENADLRLNALKDLAGYGYTKVKAIELSGPDGGDITVKADLVAQIMAGMD